VQSETSQKDEMEGPAIVNSENHKRCWLNIMLRAEHHGGRAEPIRN